MALSSTAQAIEIFRIADKFNAPDLAELCYAYIVGHLDPSNVMPCYMFADVHGMEELKLRCLTVVGFKKKRTSTQLTFDFDFS